LQVVTGDHKAGAALAEHHDVDCITFTGSGEIGRKIMTASANSNLANGTKYGLGASIWSNNLENVLYATKRLIAGNINVNGGTGPMVELPFGAFKESGFGFARDRSLHAIDKYSDLKNVIIRTAH
jgi:acyl-CoA reductase-like NAD-dependent aldehyde dehydrogenase